MPARLRPKADIASDAILVGDPGRALLLAQELLEKPKMSNHARGLWGYSGRTPAGRALTIQATGMGAPSAAIVISDLGKLGVRRAVRIGTGTGLDPEARPGDLLLVEAAVAEAGSSLALGVAAGETVRPDTGLFAGLREQLPEARTVAIASVDIPPLQVVPNAAGVAAADLQTVALFARGRQLGIAAAALLIVTDERGSEELLAEDRLEAAAKRCGQAAAHVLSP